MDLSSLRTGGKEIGYKINGADGLLVQNIGVEDSRFGILTTGESTVMTFINPYIEGCTQAGIYFAENGISRECNLIGAFFNQASNLCIDADDLTAGQYTTMNFIGSRRLTGDMNSS